MFLTDLFLLVAVVILGFSTLQRANTMTRKLKQSAIQLEKTWNELNAKNESISAILEQMRNHALVLDQAELRLRAQWSERCPGEPFPGDVSMTKH